MKQTFVRGSVFAVIFTKNIIVEQPASRASTFIECDKVDKTRTNTHVLFDQVQSVESGAIKTLY